MDDPWGSSPWATDADDPSKSHISKSPPKSSTLEPPPRAILSASPPKPSPSSSFTSHSLWADDTDGFGDWASSGDAHNLGANGGSGWGGWAASEGSAASSQQQLTPKRRDTLVRGKNPIAWPGNIAMAASPSLSPPKRAADSSSLRQPSPDPWASEFALSREEEVSGKKLEVHEDLVDNVEVKSEAGAESVGGAGTPPLAEDAAIERLSELKSPVEDDIPDWGTPETEVDAERGRPGHAKRLSGHHEPPAPSTEHGSRPSSSGSDGSHRDDRAQDSPITSIDEDSKTRPQLQQRKVSSKVQDLVHMYDDLGRRIETEETSPAQRAANSKSRSRSHVSRRRQADTGEDEDEGEDDFGGFEEGQPEAEPLEAPEKSAVKASEVESQPRDERPSTPQSREATMVISPETPGSQASPATQQAVSSAFKDLLAKHGPVTYTPDLSLITQLFPALHPLPISDENDRPAPFYVPDHIIDDSFTDISERKTWYRVSRQGSSRKHDAGADDNNYRRITWPVATVREDTIKIVRRWMEEDSFTGRATLGGTGSKVKGNVFGWDSSAEPVALDEVFKKKRSSVPAPLRSEFSLATPPIVPATAMNGATASPTTSTNRDAHLDSSKRSTMPGVSFAPSLDGFGAQKQPVPVKRPENHPTAARPMSMPPQAFQAPASAPNVTPPVNGGAPAPMENEEDEDEWGEMMSSPQETSFTSAPFPILNEKTVSPQPEPLVSAGGAASELWNSNASAKVAAQGPAPVSSPSNNSANFSAMDFSIFETPKPAMTSTRPPVTHTNTTGKAPSDPIFPLAKAKGPAVTQTAKLSHMDEALVDDILNRLPNLTYMLR